MQIIGTLTPQRTQQIVEHITETLLPLAKEEQAKCARGRLNLWLQAEPNYATKKYMKAHTNERLWNFIQRIDSKAALAQVYFAKGGIGIDWHRDAAYAMPTAHIINLGAVCLECKDESGNLISLELSGGEIIRFNSKQSHRAIPRSDDRIGIGVWQAKIDIHNPANWH